MARAAKIQPEPVEPSPDPLRAFRSRCIALDELDALVNEWAADGIDPDDVDWHYLDPAEGASFGAPPLPRLHVWAIRRTWPEEPEDEPADDPATLPA